MSGTYLEYATVYGLRAAYLGGEQNADDALLLDLIRGASEDINSAAGYQFAPTIETRTYDVPKNLRCLRFSDAFNAALLEMTTITNGDGAVLVAGTDYKLYPLNSTPKTEVQLLSSSANLFTSASNGDAQGAIAVLGVWGYHRTYSAAWELVRGATLAESISANATSLKAATGKIKAGDLLRIDAEYFYVVSVTTASPNDTLEVAAAANGSTAAGHTSGATLYRWKPQANIAELCRRAAAAYYKLRSNPGGDTISVDGMTFQTPKDVTAFIVRTLENLFMERSPL